MQSGHRRDEILYHQWLVSFGVHGLSFADILTHIWAYLHPGKEHTDDKQFNYLICFVQRANKKQGPLIESLCGRTNQSTWDSLTTRATCVYIRARKNLESLRGKLAKLIKAQWYKYLYRVLSNKLTRCNKEYIKEQLSYLNPVQYREWAQGRYQSLDELMHREELRRQALELFNWLLENWTPQRLNVLCHICESVLHIPTQRLADESPANIHKLHSRLRKSLVQLRRERNISQDLMRVLLGTYAERICQLVPVSTTYKHKDGKNESDI